MKRKRRGQYGALPPQAYKEIMRTTVADVGDALEAAEAAIADKDCYGVAQGLITASYHAGQMFGLEFAEMAEQGKTEGPLPISATALEALEAVARQFNKHCGKPTVPAPPSQGSTLLNEYRRRR